MSSLASQRRCLRMRCCWSSWRCGRRAGEPERLAQRASPAGDPAVARRAQRGPRSGERSGRWPRRSALSCAASDLPSQQRAVRAARAGFAAASTAAGAALSAAKTLIIAPDGVLSQVPFAALYVRTGVRLIAQHRLLCEQRSRSTGPAGAPACAVRPAIFAQPDYHAPLRDRRCARAGATAGPSPAMSGDLPGTGEEHASLLSLFAGARSFVGAEASEPNLLNLHAPAVLHIAATWQVPGPAGCRSAQQSRDPRSVGGPAATESALALGP